MSRSIYAIFAVAVICFMLGGIMGALNAFRGEEVTAPYNIALTGADNTTAVVVLANDLMDSNKVHAEVYSPNPNDAPVPFDYVSATRRLTINGFAPDTTRQVQVVYLVSRLPDFIDLMVRFFPAFLVIGLIALVIGAAVAVFQHRD